MKHAVFSMEGSSSTPQLPGTEQAIFPPVFISSASMPVQKVTFVLASVQTCLLGPLPDAICHSPLIRTVQIKLVLILFACDKIWQWGWWGHRHPIPSKERKKREREKKKITEIYTLSRSQLQVFCTASQDLQSQKIHHVPGAHVSVSNWFPSDPKKYSTIRMLQSCSQSHGLPAGIFGGREHRGKQTLFCLLV